MDEISNHKAIFEEPSETQKLKEVLTDYRANIAQRKGNITGSIMFGVCRGKISEGIDFTDDEARLLIIVGIPIASIGDPKI